MQSHRNRNETQQTVANSWTWEFKGLKQAEDSTRTEELRPKLQFHRSKEVQSASFPRSSWPLFLTGGAATINNNNQTEPFVCSSSQNTGPKNDANANIC